MSATSEVSAKFEFWVKRHLGHSATNSLAMNGISLIEIAEILGHKTLQTVKRHDHLSQCHTKELVEKTNSEIFK